MTKKLKKPKKPGVLIDYYLPDAESRERLLDDIAEVCKRHKVGWWFINEPTVPCPVNITLVPIASAVIDDTKAINLLGG